ncbi:PepSY domain-containing protein [Oricola nitratireducens]|jgi:hypothetical protein|uniref:PepSY domain-containing protein n=1 Tax=Oricola nitratireducens TaxID=2775868 RepID=UPI001866FECF|nr:PepSY domain-containing protein [Oricola nitratireducens]
MQKFVLAAIATGLLAVPAMASESSMSCGNAPQAKWMSQDAAKAKLAGMGYDVRRVKVENGCYEIYGMKDGARVQAMMNPATGEIVGNEQGEQ